MVTPSGHVFLIDEADFPVVRQHRWWAKPGHTTTYIQTNIDRRTVRLHRLLLNAAPGRVVDHINLNGLDNRRENLRLCTDGQNKANGRLRRDNTSGYRGVYWNSSANKWQAYISVNSKRLYLGVYSDPWAAAIAYNEAALRHFGEFARTNQLKEQ